MQTSRKSK